MIILVANRPLVAERVTARLLLVSSGKVLSNTGLVGTCLATFRYPLTYGSTERQYSAVFWDIQSLHHCFPAISSGESGRR